jgi:flagellar biosynthesis protein FlhA
LLLSTAVALIVTRMSKSQDMGGELAKQLFGQPRAWRSLLDCSARWA